MLNLKWIPILIHWIHLIFKLLLLHNVQFSWTLISLIKLAIWSVDLLIRLLLILWYSTPSLLIFGLDILIIVTMLRYCSILISFVFLCLCSARRLLYAIFLILFLTRRCRYGAIKIIIDDWIYMVLDRRRTVRGTALVVLPLMLNYGRLGALGPRSIQWVHYLPDHSSLICLISRIYH